MMARARGEPVPPGWILDADGRPTTNVEEFYRGGMLLPFAEHKGYALSVIVELLAVGLSGGEVASTTERGACLFVTCIAPDRFRPAEEFIRTVESVVRRLKAVPPVTDGEEVLLPGEPEARMRARRLRDGIPVPAASWDAIATVARDLGVATGAPDRPA